MTRVATDIGRVVLTLLFLGAAVIALIYLWRRYENDPWTRDGKIRADSVEVASDVSGLVTQILVHDNQFVKTGTVLFVVDKERFAAQLEQADAAVARAQATLANAAREQGRYIALGDLVSREERDQHVTAADVARAALRQAQADRRVARINFDRSDVRARVDGYVTGLTMRPGDYVTSGAARFALLDTSSYYVLGYFEENKLHRIHTGDRARIVLLGDTRPLYGHVVSMAAGITDREDTARAGTLPNVNPTFSWIRLAQRVPVRLVIDKVPKGMRLVAGRTASVIVLPTTHPTDKPAKKASLAPPAAPASGR
ncbi:efflux RND transporter periplasmic adaptor subunit [Novosphingobium kaempferiae]|uniref:efflux RND transporter periplasmic adaptor subunit n=1 Tax=Novosphingobium kaempferiae TaxID=2896849 RepID=UPI003B848A0D